MSKIILAFGAAALAISAPAFAQQDGKQKGGGNKGGQNQKAERGGGNGGGNMRGNGGQRIKVERDGGPSMRQAGNNRGNKVRGDDDRAGDKARGNGRSDDRGGDRVRMVGRDSDRGNRIGDGDQGLRLLARNFDNDFSGGRGLLNGCPPGLDKKDNGCLPPGQARKYLGARLQQSFANQLVPEQYRSWYRDDNQYMYRYGDGSIYRVSRANQLIDGIIPLLGGGANGGYYYAMGDPWPQPYDFYNVPYQYRDYYADTSDYRYRYGDGAIYRVNSGSGVVDSIVALLAGDLGVGSRLPAGYDTYNVPFAYRDRYADTTDSWYRYNDGYIYQVDPKTRLISAVIDAIV